MIESSSRLFDSHDRVVSSVSCGCARWSMGGWKSGHAEHDGGNMVPARVDPSTPQLQFACSFNNCLVEGPICRCMSPDPTLQGLYLLPTSLLFTAMSFLGKALTLMVPV